MTHAQRRLPGANPRPDLVTWGVSPPGPRGVGHNSSCISAPAAKAPG
jgi:hypothetical protein